MPSGLRPMLTVGRNYTQEIEIDEYRKEVNKTWWKGLRRSSQIALILSLFASIGFVAYAASILFGTSHSSTSLSKDRYVEVELTGASATGSIRPGGSVDISPSLTNNGDINTTAFIKVSVPTLPSSTDAAYEWEIESGWTAVDSYTDGNKAVVVYGYGTASELSVVEPGMATDAVTNGFTMRSDISGSQFNAMTDIDIDIDGYLVDSEVGTVPEDVWSLVPQE